MKMQRLEDRATGPNLRLRLVTLDDAQYVHELRTDPAYNAHLSSVTGTVEDQANWLKTYKSREMKGKEFYFVILRCDNGKRCGVVRLYDIENCHFTWGSWILDRNKPHKAALESAILSFGIGFGPLGKTFAKIDVRRENHHATSFYRRLGMREIGRDKVNIYFEYERDRYEADLQSHFAVLEGRE